MVANGDSDGDKGNEERGSELPFSRGRCIALVSTVAGAAFLNTLGVQATVIILPTIGRALDIPDSRQQWIVSAYSLTFGCFLLLWGRLADVYGKRLIFIWGSIWVTVTSLVVPFVSNEIGFDVFRGLQGLGAAAMVPTAIGILGVTFPPGKAKNYAFSCYGAGAPLGGIFGNIFGGVLGEYLDWKWVFWIFAILAFIVTIAGYFVIPLPSLQQEPISIRKSVDWVGGTLITVGLLILLFALSEGNVVGWSISWIPILIAVSMFIIAVFVVWEWYLENKTERRPLMKISIFKNVRFSAANIIMLLFFASFNNFLIFATYWFQDYLALSVIQTTIRFIPTGVSGVIVAFITAQLLSRVRGDFLLTFGTASVSISSLLFAIPIPASTTYWAYGFPAMVLSVCGADTLYPALTLFTAKSLPPEDQALGGALINAVGQVGRAIGLAIATAVQTAVIAREKGLSVEAIGSTGQGLRPMDEALKAGLRSASWFNLSIGVAALVVVLVFFRGAGKIGGKH
ncbi:MFS general substrate transporter [Lindgomyces ingoldianus]|uniref:MFS general substrate transporter n=1 Tax=Lindgomyces ingoldianus TaxID=673940 RepID=A0ACB6QFC4_9PLEO|nr:MFS general substrate transporter [Lindgomyces ingoldianus]KAF2465631.1 MFS general substrate transporter [Lindgomyces ingoldianus]